MIAATPGSQHELRRVGPTGVFPKVRLQEPNSHGYLLLAAEVDHRPPFGYFIESGKKRQLLDMLKRDCLKIAGLPDVVEAVTFKALLVPPGRGVYLKSRPELHVARFDVVVLVETASPEAAQRLRDDPIWQGVTNAAADASTYMRVVAGTNVKRIGAVDHSRAGVFLFNFFAADDVGQNLAVWEYTAGWFQDQTGLDNSTVILPAAADGSDYTIINHCRWDKLSDIVPSLLFKASFRNYVLANFEANRTAAIPILYRLA